MAELAGKVALVTGSAHGIGTAIADGLAEDGAKVHRVDRDTARPPRRRILWERREGRRRGGDTLDEDHDCDQRRH